MKKRVAIFASGNGTNADNLMRIFSKLDTISVELVLSNKADAPVLVKAKKNQVKAIEFTKADLYDAPKVLEVLKEHQIDFIVLAGFLLLMPKAIILNYPNRIINIHPSLLPKYGGKGMYGGYVHESVIANKEKESGISIHLVNEKFDDGKIIFQAKCEINQSDTPQDLAAKIHQLEYAHFPNVVRDYIQGFNQQYL